jgi:hypothetical protein
MPKPTGDTVTGFVQPDEDNRLPPPKSVLERPPGWPPPPFDPPGEPLPYVPPPDPPGSTSEPRPDWWPEDWVWPPVPEPPIEVLVPPPLPNIIWPRLPPHHPYHLPPGYHWPDNLPPGHPGHDVKPPKPQGGSGDAGSEGSGDEAGSSDSEGC